MTYKDIVFTGSFISTVCSVVGLVNVTQIVDEHLMWALGSMLVATALLSPGIGWILIKRPTGIRQVHMLAGLMVAVPCFSFAFFSIYFAYHLLSMAFAALMLIAWLASLGLGFMGTAKATSGRVNAQAVVPITLSGAVVPSALAAIGVLDAKIFVLVVCNLVLACALVLAVAGLIRPRPPPLHPSVR